MGKEAIALWVVGGLIAFTVIVLVLLFVYYDKMMKRTYLKISDAELIRLVHQLGATDHKQVAGRTALTKHETSTRLSMLSMYGAIQTLYNSMGGTMFQVKNTIPQSAKIRDISGLTPQQIVQAIVEQTNEAEVTLAQLIVIFDLKLKEARKQLKELVKQGVLTVSYSSSWRKIYTATNISSDWMLNIKKNKPATSQEQPIQLAAPQANERIKIPDAEVLKLAMEHDGRITPILLCTEKNISLEDAKQRLDDLYDHGAFTIDADEESGAIEYWLRDRKLIKRKK